MASMSFAGAAGFSIHWWMGSQLLSSGPHF